MRYSQLGKISVRQSIEARAAFKSWLRFVEKPFCFPGLQIGDSRAGARL
jgi:hypothetical protein